MHPNFRHMSKNSTLKQTLVNIRQVNKHVNEQTLILDSVDKKILKVVIDDSRLSYRELARRLGISVGTVIERLNRLEASGVIENYSAFINPKKIGFPLTVVMEISGKTRGSADLEKYLATLPNVCCVYSVTGRTDTIVIARFRNIDELNKFVQAKHSKKGIARTETLLVLDTYKEDFRPAIE